MTTTSRAPDSPTRPAVRPTRLEFVEALQELRTWSGLTLKMLEARHDILKVSTSSDYQRGVRWPRWRVQACRPSECRAVGSARSYSPIVDGGSTVAALAWDGSLSASSLPRESFRGSGHVTGPCASPSRP